MSSTTAGAIIVIGMFLIICLILSDLHEDIDHIKKLINSLDCQLFNITNKNVNTIMNEEEE